MDSEKHAAESGFRRRDRFIITAMGLLVFAVTIVLFANEYTAEWRAYQGEFRAVVEQKFGAERARQVPSGLQQIWLAELQRVDRCMTCHLGIEWEGLEGAQNPYKSHPKEILNSHALSKFGCTSCHGGQGYATELAPAHGNVEHWEEPLLGSDLAKFYLVNDRKAMMQVNCNICHRYDRNYELRIPVSVPELDSLCVRSSRSLARAGLISTR